MKPFITLLCLTAGIIAPVVVLSQPVSEANRPLSTPHVILDKFEWTYPSANTSAAVRISVTNNSDKTIKSVQLLVVAKDKKGVILQSRGSTLNTLLSKDSITAGEAKSLYFKKAFDHAQIAAMELRQATIEYYNGALEIIKR